MSEQTAAAHKKTREPFIHVTKRVKCALPKGIFIRVFAIVVAYLLSVLLTSLVSGYGFGKVAGTMLNVFNSPSNVWFFFGNLAILLGISLAVTPAFKMRFWNIGAEGQVLVGALTTAGIMLFLGGKLPDPVVILLMLVGAIAAGILWGVLPAVCKALWNTNETLFTLMMNYIAIQLVRYFLLKWDKSGHSMIGPMQLKNARLPAIGGSKYLLVILAVAVLTVFMFIYLRYTKHGYEISVVGQSENTARYIGINVKKVIIRTMALSGALCAVIGFFLVSGINFSIETGTAGGNGFTAIMVSWLAKFNPLTMVLSAGLIAFLGRSASNVSVSLGVDKALSDVVTGIILFFIIGCEFFINYQVHFHWSPRMQKFVDKCHKYVGDPVTRFFTKIEDAIVNFFTRIENALKSFFRGPRRNIAVGIVLSVCTCGIFMIYWQYLLVKETRRISEKETNCAVEMVCLIFVPFYALYWWYTRGERVRKNCFEREQRFTAGTGIVYLLLEIFCLSIVSMAIMQHDFNSLSSEFLMYDQQSANGGKEDGGNV